MPDSRHWAVLKHGGDSVSRDSDTGVSDSRVTDHVVMITPCCHAESLTLEVTVDDSLDLFLLYAANLLQRKERNTVKTH